MKKIFLVSLICTVVLGCNVSNNTNEYDENEVVISTSAIVDSLMEFTYKKNIDKLMTLYADSTKFQFIDNEGTPKNLNELKELYSNLFISLESIKVLENKVSVVPINSENAYCVWQGKEEIKMMESEMMLSSWIATIFVKKIDDSWKIIHFHATHF
jgi:hypothetical protein